MTAVSLNNYQNIYSEKLKRSQMSEQLFKKIWDLATERMNLAPGRAISRATSQGIDDALREKVVYAGPGMSGEFPIGAGSNQKIHRIVRYLLGMGGDNFSALNLGWTEFKALFVKSNPELIKAVRAELRSCLASIPLPKSQADELIVRAHVGNILSLIPFTYPKKGSPFLIPHQDNGVWSYKKYYVEEVIELTPAWISSPLPALFLTSSDGGAPILSFIGTTYPTGAGFSAALTADCTPLISVGYMPLFWGMSKVREVIKNQRNIEVVGVSLGGATGLQLLRSLTPSDSLWKNRILMITSVVFVIFGVLSCIFGLVSSLHSGLMIGGGALLFSFALYRLRSLPKDDERSKFSRFDLFRAPGLYWWNWGERFDEGPEVNLYTQPGDPVSSVGIFPKGNRVNWYELHRSDGKVENLFKSHLRTYTGYREVVFFKLDPSIENSRAGRIVKTILHLLFGPVVYFTTLGFTIVSQVLKILLKIVKLIGS